jgi:hypothetical protein
VVFLGPKLILILILIAISSLKCLRIFQVKKDPHKPNEFGPFGTKHYSFNLYDIHYIGISSMIYLKSFFEPKSEETSTLYNINYSIELESLTFGGLIILSQPN